MSKKSTSNQAPAGQSASGAAPTEAQGAAVELAASAPGVADRAQRTNKRVPDDTSVSTTLPVQSDDGSESFMAWALNQAKVDGLVTPDSETTTTRIPDDDEDELPKGGQPDSNKAKDHSDADDDDSFDADAPVLVNEDEPELETGDEEEDALDDKAAARLKKDNFKLREKRRELEAELQAEKAEREKLQDQLAKVATTADATPQFDGYFSEVKTLEDVDQVEETLQRHLDYFEDHPDGYEFTDQQGNEIVVTAEDVRKYRRQALQQQRQAAKVREVLKEHTQRASEAESLARKKYPFVFDPKQSLNQDVLELATEFPSLARDPRRSLVLGRMAIARLIESGKYTLVKRGSKPAPSAESFSPSSPAAPRQTPSRQAGRSVNGGQEGSMAQRLERGDRDALEEAAMALLNH
jgi:hypothetical protein